MAYGRYQEAGPSARDMIKVKLGEGEYLDVDSKSFDGTTYTINAAIVQEGNDNRGCYFAYFTFDASASKSTFSDDRFSRGEGTANYNFSGEGRVPLNGDGKSKARRKVLKQVAFHAFFNNKKLHPDKPYPIKRKEAKARKASRRAARRKQSSYGSSYDPYRNYY